MYAPLLANRYLTSRIIPLIAVGAVALCVALVIIVVSVMSGFLDMVRNSGKTLIGDVVVSYPISGIPYYDELIKEIEALPETAAASPIVETLGLLRMPYGTMETTQVPGEPGRSEQSIRGRVEFVHVWGIEPESLERVAGYYDKLYWRKPSDEVAKGLAPDDPRLDPYYQRDEQGKTLRSTRDRDGIVLGIEISPYNKRTRDGSYRTRGPSGAQDPDYFMPDLPTTLTLVPISSNAKLGEDQSRELDIVNEIQSGVFTIDSQRVLVPIKVTQEMLKLDEAPFADPSKRDANGRPMIVGTTPARATTIVVRARDGVRSEDLLAAVERAYASFSARMRADPTRTLLPPPIDRTNIETWEQRLVDLIGPVQKERELMRTLFSIVYIVCAALVLAIFWAIVQEKTRDIGILRAVGASRVGILWIFLRYGLLIGIVGSLVGVLLAWVIVVRLNDIHELIGMPASTPVKVTAWVAAALALVMLVRGLRRASALQTVCWTFGFAALSVIAFSLLDYQGYMVWDPAVYYFTRIPSEVDWDTVRTTVAGGILFSVIGAAIPAARAADTDPVQSLRYE
ncbi:MAG: Lipoprotein-releasing system transrane protein LolE [Planctomycetota bacterium]|jgi:lipoprotein-releasing system permease protein